MAMITGGNIEVYQHIQRHQHRQQYFDGVQVDSQCQGNDCAPKTGHGLSGVGDQYDQPQQEEIVIHQFPKSNI